MKLAKIFPNDNRDPKLVKAFTRRNFLKHSALIGTAGFGALGLAQTALGQTAAKSLFVVADTASGKCKV